MKSLLGILLVLIVFDVKVSQAASEAQLESWCNSVNEYWVSHEDFLANPLPLHETVCRTDLYESGFEIVSIPLYPAQKKDVGLNW